MGPWNLMADLEEQWGTSSIPLQALCIISKPSVNSNWSYSPKVPNSGRNRKFFCSAWPLNFMDVLGKHYDTSCMLLQAFCIISKPSVPSNLSYSPETPNLGQNRWFFLSRAILKFGRGHSKTCEHLFYAVSSFVHRFKAIGDFKLELQSGNAQFGLKSTIF